MKLRTKTTLKTPCTCHDPLVFGHINCGRAETQPNNQTGTSYATINQATMSFAEMATRVQQAHEQLDRMMQYCTEHCGTH